MSTYDVEQNVTGATMQYGQNGHGNHKLTMSEILDARDRHVTKTYGGSGVLSRLWRQMLIDLDIGPARFGEMLHDYVINPINGVPDNRKDQISFRGNVTKEFARPQMTWKVFMKALRFLNISDLEIVVRARYSNGKIKEHRTAVDLGGRHNAHAFNQRLDQPEGLEIVQPIDYLDNGVHDNTIDEEQKL